MEQREATVGLYDEDLALWVTAQVDALREGRLSALDVANVTEEFDALAKRDRRKIKSKLRQVEIHLLKLQHQPERKPRLGESPSPKSGRQSTTISKILRRSDARWMDG